MGSTGGTIHACALQAAKAAAKSMRAYAATRAINRGLLSNSAIAPEVIPTPTLHATHDNGSLPASH